MVGVNAPDGAVPPTGATADVRLRRIPALLVGIALADPASRARNGSTPRSTGLVGWRTWMLATVSAAALIASGLTAGSASAETTWLCKPGLASNPCLSSEEATVELGDGSSFVQPAQPASNPPIDCFYVYPTVSSQVTTNATLAIDPEETQIAIDQASRFSQACKVYAPIYPQLTLPAINTPGQVTPEASLNAYLGVLSAWQEYLATYNHGRGVVLIGHSQGALMLKQLIKEQIDPNPALRKQLVSAVLLGGNVLVPKGKAVGGDFQNVPACQVAGQTGCVVAYSTFLNEPPEGAFFGRVNSPLLGKSLTEEEASKLEVLCVNPAAFVQGNNGAPLLRYESTTPFPGLLGGYFQVLKAPTPWVSLPEQYSGQCERANGATWLQLIGVGPKTDPREPIRETIGPLWGSHLEDANVALGNLVELTEIQSRVYLGSLQVTSITPTSGSTLGQTAVTIKGSGFLAGATVTIGNPATSVNVVSETEITAKTAATAAGSDEVVITDASGTSTSGPSYTYYISPPPTVVTGLASAVSTGSGTLNATVNPNGGAVSQCKFEYGITASYGSSAPCTPSPGSGSSPVAVSASVTGLTKNTGYHFRISATNPGGTSKGSDQTFHTPLVAHYFSGGLSPLARIAAEEKVPVISWGTLTLTNLSTGGKVTCRNVIGGIVENPAPGGKDGPAGVGETQSFNPYSCESEACTPAATGGGPATYVSVLAGPAIGSFPVGKSATNLGWKSHLLAEGSLIRSENEGVKLVDICHVSLGGGSVSLIEHKWEGSNRPSMIARCCEAGLPPGLEFDAGSGTLHGAPPEGAAKSKIEGKLKVYGFNEQEIINAKVD